MTQDDIVLTVLRQRGERGLHTFEIRGLYIGNPSQRIAKLEARGHVIEHGPRERLYGKHQGTRYWLRKDVERPLPVSFDEDGQMRLGDAA